MQFSFRSIFGSRIPVPPKELVREVGGGNFRGVGTEFFRYFTELSDLKSYEQVLDIGCGCGRIAVPLTRLLSEAGCYEGFDIQPRAIDWCQKNITKRHPNFTFTRADIFNTRYNPLGRIASTDFRFPYEDSRFDYVILTSVFTHMLRSQIEHYMDEIKRVMKPKARCLLTCFLLNDESRATIESGRSALIFPHRISDTDVMDEKSPEAAVAYPEEYFRELIQSRGLTINEPIRMGSWSGRNTFLSFQDIVLASR